MGTTSEDARHNIPNDGVGRGEDVLMRATRIPLTVQRWLILAIPVGLVVGLWCVVKGIRENKANEV